MSSKKHKKFNVFDIFRGAQKLYGIIYMLLLAFIVMLGANYVKDIDYLNNVYKSPILLSMDTTANRGLLVVRGVVSPPVDVMKFLKPTVDLEVQGKEVYTANCLSCHGENGEGNGPAGLTLNPPPRNFVNPQPWTNGPKINEMYITVTDGIPDKGMPSFSNLSPENRFAVILYIHSYFNPALPSGTAADMMTLEEKYKLSEGVKTPNQVPVNLAMEKIVQEYDTLSTFLVNIAGKIENSNSDGAKIFQRIIYNENKALTSLASNAVWNENLAAFVTFIGTEPTDKGFKAVVYDLTQDELNVLFQYLSTLFNESRTG